MAKRKKFKEDIPLPVDDSIIDNDSKQPDPIPEVDTFPNVPAEDYYPVMRFDELQDLWANWLASLCSVESSLVRPAYEYDPKEFPKPDINWISFNINSTAPTNYPSVVHHDKEHGYDVLTDYVNEEIVIYCIGPNSYDMANYIRRAVHIEQNRDVFLKNKIGIIAVSNAMRSPIMQNESWIQQTNLTISYTRQIVSRYNVRNLIEVKTEPIADSPNMPNQPINITDSKIDGEKW